MIGLRLLAALAALVVSASAQAISVVEVKSPNGIAAYLAEDHSSPVVAITFTFSGGSALEPDDKQGVSQLAAGLFDEGAGDMDAFAFQSALEDRAISFNVNVDRDRIHGQVTTTTPTLADAVKYARLALTQPRFDQDAIERVRREILVGISAREEVPGRLAGRKLFADLFGNHPYAREEDGTAKTVGSITRADIQAWAKTHLTRDRILVGAAGDISPAQLAGVLDDLFGGLPATSPLPMTAPPAVVSATPKVDRIVRDLTQTTISIGAPGIARSDPDWYAATVADYILGSGSFASRLMNEVREKRGLAYSVSSSLSPFEAGAIITFGAGTRSDQAEQSLMVIRDEIGKMRDPGATQAEVDGAKQYLTGAWPLRFTSTGRIADLLVQIQHDHLGLDYLDRRNSLINAVTLDDVRRVSKRLYDPGNLTVVIVGPEAAAKPKAGG